MKIKLHKQCTMHRRFILKDNFKISHSGEERGAGKHKVAPGCLQAGRGNAGGLVGGLAKGVGNSAKIRETLFPNKFRNRRNIGGFCVEVPCNEDGAFRVHMHFCDDGSNDGVGLGSLKRKLGTICKPVNNIA